MSLYWGNTMLHPEKISPSTTMSSLETLLFFVALVVVLEER